jgi:ADP-ribosylglycohydrolase
MKGAIIGDYVGSAFEHVGNKAAMNFDLIQSNSRFTDDTILTIATADAILNKLTFAETYFKWGAKFPRAGYSKTFMDWLCSSYKKPYNSFGNGSAMRVSPISWLYDSLDEVLIEAKKSAEVTHNHPEGIKGAQAVASAIFLARKHVTKDEIKLYVEQNFNYDLSISCKEIIAQGYTFDMTCQGSVPQAIRCFLDSESYEQSIRNAVHLNGDTDTQAAIAGSIAEAFYGLNSFTVKEEILDKLAPELKAVLLQFETKLLNK